MTGPKRHRIPRPLLWASVLLVVVVGVLVGGATLAWRAIAAHGGEDPQDEASVVTDVPPATVVTGEVTVNLDAAALPPTGERPHHVEIQPIVDRSASDFASPVLVTLEALGTDDGPVDPVPPSPDPALDPAVDPAMARAMAPWLDASGTSMQQVVYPGQGRLGLSSFTVDLGCSPGDDCTARWRYRLVSLGPSEAATVTWGVVARAVYGTGEQWGRVPEGASLDVSVGEIQSASPAVEPAARLAAADLEPDGTITIAAPSGAADGVVRAMLVTEEPDGASTGFFLVPDVVLGPDGTAAVGASIWEVPLAAGTCDAETCTVRLRIEGVAPIGATLAIDARSGPELGAASISDQLVVTPG